VSSAETSFDVYAVYKTKTSSSTPERLSDAINSKAGDFYATMSLNKNIYFTRRTESNGIYMSRFVNGAYQKAMLLDSTINTKLQESNPYISPKEDYLIYFSDKKGGYGDVDLYISFKKKNKWSYPINLGSKVNTEIGEFCPSVDVKNKVFYFSRTEEQNGKRIENIYQIDLQELNFKALKKMAKYRQ